MGTKVYDNYQDLITFNRNSKGTALRPIGYGDELVVNGTFDTDSDWTKGAGWTISGGTATHAAGSASNINQSVAYGSAGTVYALSVGVVSVSGGTGSIQARNGGATTAKTIDSGDIGTTVTLIYVHDGLNTDVAIFAGAGTTITVDNVSVKEVLFDRDGDPLTLFLHPEGVPRIEYDADRNLKGLLIEPDGENLALYSATLGQNPVLKGFRNGLAAGYAINTQYTCSLWIKRNAGSGRTIQFNDDRGFVATYDTSTIPLNTWTRISVTATSGATIVNQIDIEQFTATTPSYDSNYGTSPDGTTTSTRIYDASDEYEVWGLQFEAGPIATSYMPTAGSTFTRGKDEASMTNVSGLIGQKEGTVYVEVDWRSAGTDQRLLSVNDGAFSNRVLIYANPSDLRGLLTADSSNVGNLGASHSGLSGIQKIAFAYSESDYELYRNGSSFAIDITGSLAALGTLTDIDIGQSAAASDQANMHIRAIQIIPRRLSDAQLTELTS